MNHINSADEINKIVPFLTETWEKNGFSKAVIGVSGGVDSAVSLSLSVRALGEENIFPVLLPYGALSTQGTLDAMEQIQVLGIPMKNIIRIDIQPAVDALAKTVTPDELRKGNIMARMRMIVLFDQAKKHHALVLGTENKTEHYLGYFTRFGDEASDAEPIIHLWKTQVYEVARYLGVTKTILEKAPTAGLWSGQTDEREFGFTYTEADEVLYQYITEGKRIETISVPGISGETINRILARKTQNEFKHDLPHTIS